MKKIIKGKKVYFCDICGEEVWTLFYVDGKNICSKCYKKWLSEKIFRNQAEY